MVNEELYKLENGKITKDGHIMFSEDIVKDLNSWRNGQRKFRNKNAKLLKEIGRLNQSSFNIIPKVCKTSYFYGIEVMDNGEEFGFEGCYNGDLNHPDPRPAHQIWVKKINAEKLIRLFFYNFSTRIRKLNYDFVYLFEEFIQKSNWKSREVME